MWGLEEALATAVRTDCRADVKAGDQHRGWQGTGGRWMPPVCMCVKGRAGPAGGYAGG